MATTAEIRNGAVMLYKGKRMKVVEFQHVKPGKGGAFVRTKMKEIPSGKILDVTFNAGARIEFIRVEVKSVQYLYEDGESFMFMDNETFDQFAVEVGDEKNFLLPGAKVDLLFDGEEVLDIRIPAHAVLVVKETEPGFRGNTATGATKSAVLETGYVIQVPLFVEIGDSLKVDTRTGGYIERVKV